MFSCRRLFSLLVPALLVCLQAAPADAVVRFHQKISSTEGNFTAPLLDEDRFGIGIASLGDLDGDGNGDIAVGAYQDRATLMGAVYVLLLNANGTVKSHVRIANGQGGFGTELDPSDEFGVAVAELGDLDDDGVVDIAVGARLDDDASSGINQGYNRGAVWILFLNATGAVKAYTKISDFSGGFTGGLNDYDWFGSDVAGLGDVDGDGIEDLAVSSVLDDDGGADRGAVWVLYLRSDGTVKSHQKISSTAGGFTGQLDDGDSLGKGLASIGDLDGDGVVDLAIGAGSDDDGGLNRGAVWIVFRNPDGTVKSHQKISSTEGNFTGSLDDGDNFGISLSLVGEACNGEMILGIGANSDGDGGYRQGAIWLVRLGSDGTVTSHSKISATSGGFTGDLDVEDAFGADLVSIGDLNDDGATDVVTGARRDDDGGYDRGAVWVLFLDECNVAPSAIDLGSVPLLEFADADFVIENNGCVPLAGDVTESCDAFSILSGEGPFVLDPGQSMVVTIRFAPIVAGPYECTVETGNPGCGAVLVTGFGQLPSEPAITSILDIGNDQGRNVRVTFRRSGRDQADSPTPILQYEIFRRIDPLPSAISRPADAPQPAGGPDAMRSDAAILTQGWDFVGWMPAHGELEYSAVAPTLADSTRRYGMHWSVFFVRAATDAPLVFFDSPPDSGYSFDNRRPGPPSNLLVAYDPAQGNSLEWTAPPDPDVYEYRVYRDTEAVFEPSPDKLVHVTEATEWLDAVDDPAQYHYLVAAVDWSGNEGEAASPMVTTGVGPAIPAQSALHQNTPNPFNPSTTIAYDVAAPGGRVVLEVFDVRGRLLRTLVDARQGPGSRRVQWDGRDDAGSRVASGLYFCRLRVGEETFTRKMTVVQ